MNLFLIILIIIIIIMISIGIYYSENYCAISKHSFQTPLKDNEYKVITINVQQYPQLEQIYNDFKRIAKKRIQTLKQNDFYYLNPSYKGMYNDCFKNITIEKMNQYTHFERTKDKTHPSIPVNGGQLARGKFQINHQAEENNLLQRCKQLFPSTRFTGYFYYPKGGFREWHTNDINIDDGRRYDWRVYLVYVNKDGKSGTRTRNLPSGKFTTYTDKNNTMNIFKLGRTERWWHCIYSQCDRVSLGLHLNDKDMNTLFSMIGRN